MAARITTEEFIKRARVIHGDRFGYEESVASGWGNKLKIRCKEHGLFEQILGDHLAGKKCSLCARTERLDRWLEVEDQFVKDNYKKEGSIFCAERLNRTARAVACRAGVLGILPKKNVREKHPFINQIIWHNLTKGAKERNLEVSICFNDIWLKFLEQNKKCALSGVNLVYSTTASEITASVDRINSKKGYTKENIQIVHKLINRTKQNLSDEIFFSLCRSVFIHNKERFTAKEVTWEINHWLDTSFPKEIELFPEWEKEKLSNFYRNG